MPSKDRNLNAGDGLAGLTRKDERRATKALEVAVGGRDAVRQALSLVERNKQAEILHAFIADPRNDRVELSELCRKAGVSVPALWSMFKHGAFSRAQVAALAKVAEGLPAVASSVMARAVEHLVRCPECYGRGRPPGSGLRKTPPKCHMCNGTGKVPEAPDLKTQELALEIGGLYHRGGTGGVHVNVTQEQQFQVAQVEQSFTDFQRNTDAVLFDTRPRAPDAPTEPPTNDDVSS